MSGEDRRTHEETHDHPLPAGAATDKPPRSKDNRTGPYGGDDGALEHARTEPRTTDNPTPDDAETKKVADRPSRHA